MRKILVILCLGIGFLNMHAQEIYLSQGKTFSSFDYVNSAGATLFNLQPSTNNIIAVGYRKPVFTKDLFVKAGTALTTYGTQGSEPIGDNYFNWEVNYLEVITGLDYNVFKVHNTQLYAHVASSFGFFLQGSQQLNNTVYDLRGNEDFKNFRVGIHLGLGITQKVSDTWSVYLQYAYNHGVSNSSKSESGSEELSIHSNNINIGLRIQLPNKD